MKVFYRWFSLIIGVKMNYTQEGNIIGLDTNVLVDMVESKDFKDNIRQEINLGVLKIYTTNIVLAEAREVLKRKRGYSNEEATESLQNILKEFNIIKIEHNKEGNELGKQWLEDIKKKVRIKEFKTFPTDCKILANLFKQVKINVYITEDRDIEKTVKILKLPFEVRIIGEASQIKDFEVKRFLRGRFKEKRKSFHKHYGLH